MPTTAGILTALLLLGAPPITFEDRNPQAGVDFHYQNGSRGKHDLPEIMGGGVAFIDFDADGKIDLYFCNGGPIGGKLAQTDDSPCKLYRNLGDGKFVEVDAGAPGPGYAMGTAVGDFDNDGLDDLFVTGWKDRKLYRNLGGRFEDVTEKAGLVSPLWTTSAAWADLDGDFDLDLVVAAYLDYDAEKAPFCAAPDGRRDYCGPEDFNSQPDRLYRNNGDGTFTDVSIAGGFIDRNGRSLGVLICDLVGNSLPDIFIADDGTPGRLYENLGGLHFREVGEEAGVAIDAAGEPLAGMGVAAGQLPGDGRIGIVVTNFFNRSTVAFESIHKGIFRDASADLGLKTATKSVLGFGIALIDFDADGRPDLIQANGHVLDRERLGIPFAMKTKLLRNNGRTFDDVSNQAGTWFDKAVVGRGLATGDLDGDGRPDVVISGLDGPPALLRNTTNAEFITVELIGAKNRQPFGSRLKVERGGRTLNLLLNGGGSYLSSSERRLFLPAPGIGEPRRWNFEVHWPSGKLERWEGLQVWNSMVLKEGTSGDLRVPK